MFDIHVGSCLFGLADWSTERDRRRPCFNPTEKTYHVEDKEEVHHCSQHAKNISACKKTSKNIPVQTIDVRNIVSEPHKMRHLSVNTVAALSGAYPPADIIVTIDRIGYNGLALSGYYERIQLLHDCWWVNLHLNSPAYDGWMNDRSHAHCATGKAFFLNIEFFRELWVGQTGTDGLNPSLKPFDFRHDLVIDLLPSLFVNQHTVECPAFPLKF